jgi:plasmid stabilization system protein ParE
MAYKVKLLPIVHSDLREAKKWYQDKNEILAQEFKEEVDIEVEYIGEYPHHFQRRYKELRQSLLHRFPYSIFYLIDEEKKRIIVFGLLHTSRNPELVRKRIKK